MDIGILVTSNGTSEFAARHPHDGEKFTALLSPLRPGWRFRSFQVWQDAFPDSPQACDGWVISGSPASVLDGHGWIDRLLAFIREAHAQAAPMIGCCFGHQAMAAALGGQVERGPRWSLGRRSTRWLARAAWMDPPMGATTLYAAHKDHVTALPAGAVRIGEAEDCTNAAFAVGGHMMTTQYHPEMPSGFLIEMCDELEGHAPADVLAAARQDFAHPAQGREFGGWMCRFLETASAARG